MSVSSRPPAQAGRRPGVEYGPARLARASSAGLGLQRLSRRGRRRSSCCGPQLLRSRCGRWSFTFLILHYADVRIMPMWVVSPLRRDTGFVAVRSA